MEALNDPSTQRFTLGTPLCPDAHQSAPEHTGRGRKPQQNAPAHAVERLGRRKPQQGATAHAAVGQQATVSLSRAPVPIR
eukprot:5738670-Prymnesium_polylepis.1